MKASGMGLAMLGGGGVVFGAAVLFAVLTYADYRALRREQGELIVQRQAALDDSREAERQRQAAEQALAAQREKTARLEADLAAAKAQTAAATTNHSPGSNRQAVRAQVFAGRQALGDAWVLQGGQTSGGAGGKAPPVVLLDEAVLSGLRTVLSREAPAPATPTEVTVNHNYPTYTPYTAWWPVYYVIEPNVPTNPPPSGNVKPAPTPPPRAGGNDGSGIWRPTQKPFLPSPSPWPIVTPWTQPVAKPAPRPAVVQPAMRPATRPALTTPAAPVNRPIRPGTTGNVPGR